MVSVGFKTDRGVMRGGNEDSIFVLPAHDLYIVADGVGGHNSGQLASRMTVGYIAQYVALNPIADVKSESELKSYFLNCFQGANDLVFNKSMEEPENEGMATTAVLACFKDGWAYIVNVGDSRAYLIRDGIIRQITEDHTCVQGMINSGLITEEEAANHPDKNMITRAIGGDFKVNPDFFRFETCHGDVLLLCSDGLYGEVSDEQILSMVTAEGAETMHTLAKDLVDQANRNGGKDNISVICMRVI